MSTKTYEIFDGPNREALVSAFQYAYDDNAKISLKFSIALDQHQNKDNDGRIYIAAKAKAWRITLLQHEDGSGQSFNIEGFCKAYLLPAYPSQGEIAYLPYSFKACYSTKTRRGKIEMTEYPPY